DRVTGGFKHLIALYLHLLYSPEQSVAATPGCFITKDVSRFDAHPLVLAFGHDGHVSSCICAEEVRRIGSPIPDMRTCSIDVGASRHISNKPALQGVLQNLSRIATAVVAILDDDGIGVQIDRAEQSAARRDFIERRNTQTPHTLGESFQAAD